VQKTVCNLAARTGRRHNFSFGRTTAVPDFLMCRIATQLLTTSRRRSQRNVIRLNDAKRSYEFQPCGGRFQITIVFAPAFRSRRRHQCGDGKLSFTPPLMPARIRWTVSRGFRYRRSNPSMLMASQIGEHSLAIPDVNQSDEITPHDRPRCLTIHIMSCPRFRPASRRRKNGFVGARFADVLALIGEARSRQHGSENIRP
jgi:hypothetical protein